MGKRGSWFSALKKVFSSAGSNKEKLPNNRSVKKNSKEKKKVVKHGGESRSSFIPLFREPSSIEKILGEADNQNLFTTTTRPPPSELPKTLPTPVAVGTTTSLPQVSSPPRAADSPLRAPPSSRVPSSRAPPTITSSFRPPSPQRNHRQVINYPFRTQPPTLTNLHPSATRIQAAYRGYLARRSFRALKGLVRLQGVVKSQNVQRQTMNAMKQMQLLVRVQTQIHSQRLQMLENQALRYQSYRNDKEAEGTLSKWTLNQLSETGKNEDWDDSLLTKEEVEESLRKKVEATIKRERALAYAYAHQSRKADARSAQNPLDLRSNGFPRWWNWMEPAAYPSEHQTANKNFQSTPSRSIPSRQKASPRFHAAMHQNYALDSYESGTPSSSKLTIPVRGKQIYTPSRTPTPNSSVLMKYKRPSTARAANSVSDVPMNDTDSLTSCPPLSSAPNYMAPTVSAKAKLRAYSNPKERIPATPGNDSKRRFSFPLAPNFGSFKWSKGSSHHDDSASQKVLPKHESARSVEEFSVDSAVSMPSIGGKKPFNRFV